MTRLRTIPVLIAIVISVSACGSEPTGPLPPAPEEVTAGEFDEIVATSGPAVVNVWASWCLPCRSEAPLIAQGASIHPAVTFIGLNVKDGTPENQQFIAEYLADADMRHLADPGGRIPIELGGGPGVPITFFYAADGTLAATHRGVIDEPTLARFLDEIDR